jgi:7-cyano-7-deazaguanine synthase
MIPKTIIHLLSGGMDSTVLLYDLLDQGHDIHCLLFDYGQRHLKELDFARWHCKWRQVLFTEIKIPQLKGSDLTDGSGGIIVPNRNAIFLSIAVNVAIAANATTVTFAANADDEAVFPDCRKAFVVAMNASVKAAGYNIEICAPYLDWPKWKIGAMAQHIRVPITETWSCYKGSENPCGDCPACLKREIALK